MYDFFGMKLKTNAQLGVQELVWDVAEQIYRVAIEQKPDDVIAVIEYFHQQWLAKWRAEHSKAEA